MQARSYHRRRGDCYGFVKRLISNSFDFMTLSGVIIPSHSSEKGTYL